MPPKKGSGCANGPVELLLLLHLLQIDKRQTGVGQLPSALHQRTPILRSGQFAVEGRRALAGFNMHGNIELAVSMATENAVGGWGHICLAASDGGADVAVVSDEVVGGVDAHPSHVADPTGIPIAMFRTGHLSRRGQSPGLYCSDFGTIRRGGSCLNTRRDKFVPFHKI